MIAPILAAQHAAYTQARARLFNGITPPERPRRIIAVRRQPHRPDYVEPMPVLPHIVETAETREKVSDVLASLAELRDGISPPGFWREIVDEVCAKHGFTPAELLSPRRYRPLVAARHEAMYRMSKETDLSLPAIGRRIGGRDHTTVINGVKQHEKRMREAAALNG